MPLNSGFVWEPAGGFEPSTCCLRISWLILHHCPLVSMDVEYFRVSLFADSTEIHDCVWLFILLAVSLAVKKSLPCVARITQSLATQTRLYSWSYIRSLKATVSLLRYVVAALTACYRLNLLYPNWSSACRMQPTPPGPGRCSLPSAMAPDAVVLGCCRLHPRGLMLVVR